jgi:hypothetical protein
MCDYLLYDNGVAVDTHIVANWLDVHIFNRMEVAMYLRKESFHFANWRKETFESDECFTSMSVGSIYEGQLLIENLRKEVAVFVS